MVMAFDGWQITRIDHSLQTNLNVFRRHLVDCTHWRMQIIYIILSGHMWHSACFQVIISRI